MNYSASVFLVNRSTRAIRCIYDPGEAGLHRDAKSDSEGMKYVFKTFDETIVKDDIVVVPTETRVGFTCVRVVEIDVDVDYDSPHQFRWIVAKVNVDKFELRLKEEKELIDAVKKADVERKREELASTMLKTHRAAIEGLAITKIGE